MGKGVKATKKFCKGAFICEYAGELLTRKQALSREARYQIDKNIGSFLYFFKHDSKQYW